MYWCSVDLRGLTMDKLLKVNALTLFNAGKVLCLSAAFIISVSYPPVLLSTDSEASQPRPATLPDTLSNARIHAINKGLGRGINFGNALDAPSEGAWGPKLQAHWFDLVASAGFDSIRLPIRWSAHAAQSAPYTIEPAFMQRVDWAISQAQRVSLPIIINVHHYDALMNDPAEEKNRFTAIWKQIAERYSHYPDSLLFELLNEPHGKFNDKPEHWNQLLEETLTLVRRSNPHRAILVGSARWQAVFGLESLRLPADPALILSVHYYRPFAFTHQGAGFVDRPMPTGITWPRSGSDLESSDADFENSVIKSPLVSSPFCQTDDCHKRLQYEMQLIVKDFAIVQQWAAFNDLPVNVGEFGVFEEADMASRARWTKAVQDHALLAGMSTHYWAFGTRFSVYDQQQDQWFDSILSALLH